MRLAMIGLGKMGGNMTRRLLEHKFEVVGYATAADAVREAESRGAIGAHSLGEVLEKLGKPRIVWMMIPAGKPVDDTIEALIPKMDRGDILIDGGNSRWTDSVRRAEKAASRGVGYLDCGTSGGVWGLAEGYCMMIGGDEKAFALAEPIFKALAPEGGYRRVGPSGSGHFVKMVHNAIEYAMMQGYAEGFEVLSKYDHPLDLASIADLWNHGGVVRSWLLELAADAFRKDPGLKSIEGYVDDSGEGRWTLEYAIDHAVPTPGLAESLFVRFRSRQKDTFTGKVLAALRNEFGGHAVKKA
jgi:6-phosphogluconate dehydrogenase